MQPDWNASYPAPIPVWVSTTCAAMSTRQFRLQYHPTYGEESPGLSHMRRCLNTKQPTTKSTFIQSVGQSVGQSDAFLRVVLRVLLALDPWKPTRIYGCLGHCDGCVLHLRPIIHLVRPAAQDLPGGVPWGGLANGSLAKNKPHIKRDLFPLAPNNQVHFLAQTARPWPSKLLRTHPEPAQSHISFYSNYLGWAPQQILPRASTEYVRGTPLLMIRPALFLFFRQPSSFGVDFLLIWSRR